MFCSCILSDKQYSVSGIFGNHVDKWTLCIELYVTWLFVRQSRHCHDSCCDGSCLGALFAHFDFCLLEHSRNKKPCICHTAEIGVA